MLLRHSKYVNTNSVLEQFAVKEILWISGETIRWAKTIPQILLINAARASVAFGILSRRISVQIIAAVEFIADDTVLKYVIRANIYIYIYIYLSLWKSQWTVEPSRKELPDPQPS